MAVRKTDPAHAETERLLAEMEKRIQKEYALAEKDIQAKIDDYMERFSLKDQKWQEWVKDGTKTKEQYKQWRIGQMAVGKRWESLKQTVSEELYHADQIAKSIVKGYMPEVYALNFNYGTYEVEKGAKVNTSFTLYDRQSVERILRDNPQMLPAPGKKVSQAIAEGRAVRWNSQQLQSVMIQGILQGESIPKLAARLAKEVGDSDMKASIRNARTMTTGAQNAGRIDSYKRAEDKGIKMEQMWRATLDMRTRHEHRMLDGQKVKVGEPFKVDGYEIRFPGDPSAPGYLIYNCRCTVRGVVDGLEPQAIKYRDASAIDGMSYDEWKAQKKSESNPITLQKDKGEAIAESYRREYRNKKRRNIGDVTSEYVNKATPNSGIIDIPNGYNEKSHREEIAFAEWIHKTLGGNIEMIKEKNNVKNPDYKWNGRLWDLKTIGSNKFNTIDQHIRDGLKQIDENKGGIFLDMTNSALGLDETMEMVKISANRRVTDYLDVFVRKNDAFSIYRVIIYN